MSRARRAGDRALFLTFVCHVYSEFNTYAAMTTNPPSSTAIFDDAECVRLSLAGNREAFEKIVVQYQSLICSLTYSATGSLRESEDVAQETFVIAWRRLKELRDAEKLRPWLCGIARHLISNTLRQQQREPTHGAESLDDVHSVRASDASPSEAAINREEAALLWRSLERIPELYREPLILFYREHHSTERIAAALDLSEETARQRLSRGRKLLQEEVTAFVEGALERSAPGVSFTASVLSALPMAASSAAATALSTSAKATAISATSATTGAAAKSAAILGSLGGWFAILGGAWVSWMAKREATKSPRERRFVTKMTGIQVALLAACLALFLEALDGGIRILRSPLVRDMEISAAIFLLWAHVGLHYFQRRRQFQIQHEDQTFDAAEWRLRRTGLGTDSITGSAPSFWLVMKRSALSFVFLAIITFRWPVLRTPQALSLNVGIPLFCVFFFNWFLPRRWFRKDRPRPIRVPSLGFVVGLPIALTFLVIYALPPARAWNSSMSIREMGLLNAAVISAYALATGIYLWKGRSIPRCD